MATPLNSYSFSDSIRASGRSCDYEYFLIPVLFVKGKEMVVKKFTFFVIVWNFCYFLLEIYYGFFGTVLGEIEWYKICVLLKKLFYTLK